MGGARVHVAETKCRNCEKTIWAVQFDRKQIFKKMEKDYCLFMVSEAIRGATKDRQVFVPVPNSALCRDAGDEDLIIETIHCPECGGFPFLLSEPTVFMDSRDMAVVFYA